MIEYFFDHLGILDGRNDFDIATAAGADSDVDVEYAL